MEYSWKSKIHRPYGRTKANAPCRKHPKHIQSPGVCSLCLNRKLSRLTNASSSSSSSRGKRPAKYSPSSSSSSFISSLSSSDVSSYSSPVGNYMGSRARKSTRVFKNLGQKTLKKSRSVAFFLHRRKQEDDNGGSIHEIKRGFWSKLLPAKTKALMHSRTARDVQVITVVQ